MQLLNLAVLESEKMGHDGYRLFFVCALARAARDVFHRFPGSASIIRHDSKVSQCALQYSRPGIDRKVPNLENRSRL